MEAALQSQTPLVETAWDGEDEKDDDEEEDPGQQIKDEPDDVEDGAGDDEGGGGRRRRRRRRRSAIGHRQGHQPAGLVVTSASRSSHPDFPVPRPSKSPRLL